MNIRMFLFSFFYFSSMVSTHSESLSEISLSAGAYCSLYSRTEVLVEILHADELVDADTDIILQKATNKYSECLSILPALLPVSQGLDPWLADMRDLAIVRAREGSKEAGTEPATAEPDAETDEETWKEQCRAEYRSWDEETGTVVRRGSPARVRCPCGGEVQCGGSS